jgi:hypothetical protein
MPDGGIDLFLRVGAGEMADVAPRSVCGCMGGIRLRPFGQLLAEQHSVLAKGRAMARTAIQRSMRAIRQVRLCPLMTGQAEGFTVREIDVSAPEAEGQEESKGRDPY